MTEVWFHADNPWGKAVTVYDESGTRIGNVRSYELISRTAILYKLRNYARPPGVTQRVLVEDGKPVMETKILPDSYIVVGGVRY